MAGGDGQLDELAVAEEKLLGVPFIGRRRWLAGELHSTPSMAALQVGVGLRAAACGGDGAEATGRRGVVRRPAGFVARRDAGGSARVACSGSLARGWRGT